MALASLLMPDAGGGAADGIDGILAGSMGGGMDPMTSAMISAGSNVLGKALAPSSAGPSRADSGGQNWLSFDNSGWTVSTGSSKAEAAVGLSFPPWLMAVAALLAAVAWVRTKKH